MAENIFEKWNKTIDIEGLRKDVESASNNTGGNYVEVPANDTYEVKLVKAEVRPTKTSGDPMATLQFKVQAGDYKGNSIFMNQVILQGFQIDILDDFLKSLDTGVDVEFIDYAQYNDMLMDIVEACEEQNLSFALEYGVNNKGYNTYKIKEIFED